MRMQLSLPGTLRMVWDALMPQRSSRRTHALAVLEPHAGVVSLSARSAFASLIEALGLRAGDEIAMSAINIGDMARLAEAYGLRVVPVAVDPHTMRPDVRALAAAITPRTKMFVAAYLFGGRTSLAQCSTITRAHGVTLVADAAQAFGSENSDDEPRWLMDEDADVTLLSFGSIKTATAFGGGVAVCRDHALADRMRVVQASWERRGRRKHLRRALTYLAFGACMRPRTWPVVLWFVRCRGLEPDAALNELMRGFGAGTSPEALRDAVRRRPDSGLEATVARRLARGVDRSVRRRQEVGRAIGRQLGMHLVGNRAAAHAWWMLPVACRDPLERQRLRSALLRSGFDAVPIEATTYVDLGVTHGSLPPVRSLQHALILPSPHGMSMRAALRMAEIVREEMTADPARMGRLRPVIAAASVDPAPVAEPVESISWR